MKRWILRLRLYRLAAWLYETYRLIAKPRTHGALVALWHQRQVLLVEASYRRELSLPGGWINRNETARMAAQRELAEGARRPRGVRRGAGGTTKAAGGRTGDPELPVAHTRRGTGASDHRTPARVFA